MPYSVYFPSAAGLLTNHRPNGEGLIAWHLLQGLAQRGHDVVAACPQADVIGDASFEIVELGRGIGLESLQPLVYARLTRRAFAAHGGADRFAIAHWLFPFVQAEMTFTPPAGVAMVTGPLSLSWPAPPQRGLGTSVEALLRPITHGLYRRANRRTAAVLVSVADIVDELPPRLARKATVVPFGIDYERFSVEPLPARMRVIYVGRLSDDKGVGTLLKAWPAVTAALPEARLQLVGDGPMETELRRAADLPEFRGTLEVAGRIEHDGIPAALAGASLLCLPSVGEPYGMVLLEAMAAGRPVIASRSGGPRTIVDDPRGGRLVEPHDAGDLARALLELLGSDRNDLTRMGEHNRALVERRFGLDVVLDMVEQIYERAVRTGANR